MHRLYRSRLLRYLRQLFTALPKRAWLTLRYQGAGTFLWRIVTFPLRLTPIGPRIGLGARADRRAAARAWYRSRGRPVSIVIPTYGPPDLTLACVESLKRTVSPKRARIIVADDGSAPEYQERLRDELDGVELILGEDNVGFAANSNRGLAATGGGDVVLLNNDVVAHDDWLEFLQFAAYGGDDIGIVGPKLLYPDGTIQSAGAHRNRGAPEWFDHRYRFRPATHGPANTAYPALAMPGACLYIKRDVIDAIGLLDERYAMAYEDIDYCLRAWEAGFYVQYFPDAELTHHESKTRGMVQGDRELASQRAFWERWGGWFDDRPVRAEDGKLRILYVTEDTGVGGGHRVVFEHLNGLRECGHHVELYSLDGPPDWFELEVPVRTFDTYRELQEELAQQDAIKVATWWNTSAPVWNASVLRGIPAYFVQDIETSYYPDAPDVQHGVLASYREEFRYLTTSTWVRDRLRELGLDADIAAPGVDLGTFADAGGEPAPAAVLAVGRSQPLKNFPLTLDAWQALPEPRPELWLFGVEPEVAPSNGAIRYVEAPSDQQINELMGRATVFVQTSVHEGFCLPILEAMAAGLPVVCTDADGNRDFCEDGVNCLMVESRPESVSEAIARVIGDEALRRRLAEEGKRTAARYGWDVRIDAVERFFEDIAP